MSAIVIIIFACLVIPGTPVRKNRRRQYACSRPYLMYGDNEGIVGSISVFAAVQKKDTVGYVLPQVEHLLCVDLFRVSYSIPFQGMSLHLDSTATQRISQDALLWLHGPTHRGTLTKYPCSSSPAE